MKKYLVIGGEVISQYDGEHHYVNARKLVELYHLDIRECILSEENDETMKIRGRNEPDLLILRPRYDGNYKIPNIKKEDL